LAHEHLQQAFAATDEALAALERDEDLPARGRGEVVARALGLCRTLIDAYVLDAGRKVPAAADADILQAFRVLVKGDPSWNAIRDNCRELVYYRNCIQLGRSDALPAAVERMAVRIARHVYLYMRTRCERERRLA
jgi:hypothetical protein